MKTTELPEKVRTFIAIKPADSIIAALETAQGQLRRSIDSDAVRWTRPEQIHLTLQFLGYVERESLDAFQSILGNVCNEVPGFRLCAQRVGCFPSGKRPRIVWAGLAGNLDALQTLKEKLDVALEPLGYLKEKREFNPHMTIGRVSDLKAAEARKLSKAIMKFGESQFGEWHVREISLVQSVLSPKGASYHILKSFPLKNFRSQR